jgi:hypothetical protein
MSEEHLITSDSNSSEIAQTRLRSRSDIESDSLRSDNDPNASYSPPIYSSDNLDRGLVSDASSSSTSFSSQELTNAGLIRSKSDVSGQTFIYSPDAESDRDSDFEPDSDSGEDMLIDSSLVSSADPQRHITDNNAIEELRLYRLSSDSSRSLPSTDPLTSPLPAFTSSPDGPVPVQALSYDTIDKQLRSKSPSFFQILNAITNPDFPNYSSPSYSYHAYLAHYHRLQILPIILLVVLIFTVIFCWTGSFGIIYASDLPATSTSISPPPIITSNASTTGYSTFSLISGILVFFLCLLGIIASWRESRYLMWRVCFIIKGLFICS